MTQRRGGQACRVELLGKKSGPAPGLGSIGAGLRKRQTAGAEALAQALLTEGFFIGGEVVVADVTAQHHAVVTGQKAGQLAGFNGPQGLNIVAGVGG